jgi:hypothetical protein
LANFSDASSGHSCHVLANVDNFVFFDWARSADARRVGARRVQHTATQGQVRTIQNNSETHERTNARTHEHTNTQTHEHTNTRVLKESLTVQCSLLFVATNVAALCRTAACGRTAPMKKQKEFRCRNKKNFAAEIKGISLPK